MWAIATGTISAFKKKEKEKEKSGKESQYMVSHPNSVRICQSGWTGNQGMTQHLGECRDSVALHEGECCDLPGPVVLPVDVASAW